MGYQTGAELNVKDTFYLGRTAHMQNKPEIAIKWLEEAALQAAADGGRIVDETQVNIIIDIFYIVCETYLHQRTLIYYRYMFEIFEIGAKCNSHSETTFASWIS